MKKLKFLLTVVLLTACMSASAQFTNTSSRSKASSGSGLTSGYKGFTDLGVGFSLNDYYDGVCLGLSTTHGYQINSHIFAGIGVGANYYIDAEAWGLPIFSDVRYTILDSKISPFVDGKIGYSVLDAEGFYFYPSVGCRFGLSDSFALTLSTGYEMLSKNGTTSSWAIRAGIEF